MSQAPASSLNCLLLPLSDRILLLPSAAVAEVIRYPGKPEPVNNAPAWLLGRINWRGLELPLVSFEAASGKLLPSQGRQMAVLNLSSGQGALKFYALLLQGFPRPLRVDEQLPCSDAPLLPLELSAVSLANGKIGKIPNLPALEQQLLSVGEI